ncbi:DUF4174 domain-containing protein [Frigidibacter oleivorans]|uniref:DUF4174 domain-containing protein n=1 Tax=Frigidibacter oleivorans TaxID=2487129 RepID=UPI001F2273A7|nr:DUF4174 domain-containing protein [Frigidibacter oleivorans]
MPRPFHVMLMLLAVAAPALAQPLAAQDRTPPPMPALPAASAAPAAMAQGEAVPLPGDEGADDALPEAASAEAPFPLPAEGLTIEQFRFDRRLVIVLADTPQNPAFIDQIRMLAEGRDQMEARDAVVIADADPEADSAIRARLRPRGFMLVLIDKDGQIAQRKPFPWTVREITRAIDKMPLRQEELREERLRR